MNTIVLEFGSISSLIAFLLTCRADSDLLLDPNVYDNLNTVYYRGGKSPAYLVMVQAALVIRNRLATMAKANRGTVLASAALPAGTTSMRVSQMMRRIPLSLAPSRKGGSTHVLVALWGASDDTLCSHLQHLWNLGAGQMEIAFVKGKDRPSHLIRILSMRHPDAVHGWSSQNSEDVELYVPASAEHNETSFYVLWGYRFPTPGLAQLGGDEHKLVLLRPGPSGQAPDWIAFAGADAEFFLRPYEVVEVDSAIQEQPLIVGEPGHPRSAVPLELALVPKPAGGLNRLWQIDKDIDRERRALRDLEVARAQLVSGEREDVYFAYRFDQPTPDSLNPLLSRLLQRRLGTLMHYDYAYCEPKHETPYHLVISKQTQRQVGLSLQLADRVYYLPAQWHRWGVKLFLPLEMELAPRVDSTDAVPLLQRFLEQADPDANEVDFRDWAAILWDRGPEGQILQSLVVESLPLLSQFRLFNSFQSQVAQSVHEATRVKLLERMRANFLTTTTELDELERDLLAMVGKRSTEIEGQYSQMNARLDQAQQLVTSLQAQVEKLTAWVMKLPDDWHAFVKSVNDMHASLCEPATTAAQELSQQVAAGQQSSQSLIQTARALLEQGQLEYRGLMQSLASFDGTRTEFEAIHNETTVLTERISHVLVAIAEVHGQLEERINACRAERERADSMKAEIDQIAENERSVKARLEILQPQHIAAKKTEAEINKLEADVVTQRRLLTARSAALFEQRQTVTREAERIAAQLGHIETQVAASREQSSEMESLYQQLQEQVDLVDAHSTAIDVWNSYRDGWKAELVQRGRLQQTEIESMQALAETAEQQHEDLTRIVDGIAEWKERLLSWFQQWERNQNHGEL